MCNRGGDDCFRLSFPVYFYDSSVPLGTEIEVQNLQISGTVMGGIVDEGKSDACAPSFNFIAGMDGLSFTFAQSVTTLTVPVYSQSGIATPLVEIIMQAKPGTAVSVHIDEVSFTFASTQISCSLPQSAIHEAYPHTMSTPIACINQNWELGFGNTTFDDDGTHIREKIPITFSQDLTLEEIDFQIALTDLNGNLEGVEVETNHPEIIFTVESLANGVYQVYAYGPSGNNSIVSLSASEPVGWIYLQRPSLNNVEVDVELSYDYARLHVLGGECCSPVLNPGPGDLPYAVQIAGDDYCDTDLRIELIPVVPELAGVVCEDALPIVDYYVSVWNDGPVDRSFDLFDLEIKFLLEEGASLSVLSYDEPLCDMTCVNQPCFEIDAIQDKVFYVYCNEQGSFTLHSNSELTFIVRVQGGSIDDCVSGAYFREAHLGLINSNDPICAPIATNSSATFCFQPKGPIEGLVAKENGSGVENVDVNFLYLPSGDPLPNCTASLETAPAGAECGYYHFCSDCVGGYDVRPSKVDGAVCGVTTYDMVLISRHILGIALLDSPYKMIAADVNDSHTISTLDLVDIQRLILLLYEDFPNNTSWRFVDALYDFPDPTNPWAEVFPENVYVNPYDATQAYSVDFVAIKVGDVDLSCPVCGGDFQEPSDPNKVVLYLNNQGTYQPGDVIDLTFRVKNFIDFNSYQMGIGYDTDYLSYAGVYLADLSGVAAVEGDDFNVDDTTGQIRTLWYDNQGGTKTLNDGDGLFRLRFTANAALSDLNGVIWLADSILGSWTYDDTGTRHLFDLQDENGVSFNSADSPSYPSEASSLRLSPNPFNQDVELSMLLQGNRSYRLKLEVFDFAGREVWHGEYRLLSGKQKLILPFGKLERGLYLLRLRCNDQITYHKLIRQ